MCRYARSLGLAARQNTPAIDGAFYRPNDTSYQLQPSFHPHSTEPEPTARARRAVRAAKGQENEKVITRADVVAAIKNAATMDFLRGVVDPSMAPSADEIAAAEEEDL